ncbi:unnamed protein product [Medioppia subpectinata]|uniref:Uncharacterized protein n=1 Tax=Medioppia subpectinata TaxID=1979941 RepID=A0A7R9PVI6_9ACAR|nr:unnamed protein product [Medioppia subpectinata]CAG2102731.1 unnamed protein product [Medioppia subpectinata]
MAFCINKKRAETKWSRYMILFIVTLGLLLDSMLVTSIGNVMAIALSGLALGLLAGPPFGGVMYEFVGKSSPFFVLAGLALFDGCLQTCVLDLKVVKEKEKGASLWRLMLDPYVAITAGALCVGSIGIGVLEPSLPLFMKETMHSKTWEQGIAFLPSSISYLIGANIFGPLGYWLGRYSHFH